MPKDDTITDHDRERFLACVTRGGPYACWPYTGRTPFFASSGQVSPFAMAWRIGTDRSFPEGEVAYHRCGSLTCANPRHIKAASRSEALREAARIKREGPSCRVEVTPEREAPMLTHVAPADATRTLPPGVCSYCGGTGKAKVCGRPCSCPSCSAKGWNELVAKYGPESA